jgi:hypothetical protein
MGEMSNNMLNQKEDGYGGEGTIPNADVTAIECRSNGLNHGGVSEHETEAYRHIDQSFADEEAPHQTNGSQWQTVNDTFPEQSFDGAAWPPVTQNRQQYPVLDTDTGSHHQLTEVAVQPRHARAPSTSQKQQESLLDPRPKYVRALSSQMPESVAPQMTPQEAHTEVLQRLGKATRTLKTLKRRGSNESLSSLLSYSIRRPSMPSRPESGHSLDTLAHVLEDAAQEGNLALVEATMALGADPNFRSVNRLKNRRHDALNKATAAGHVEIIDYLLRQGASYHMGDTPKSDPFNPIDYKLLDAAYAGYMYVARYLIANQGANPLTSQWPRAYFDATRTVYRRVTPAHVSQRTVLSALSKALSPDSSMSLLNLILHSPDFNPTAPAAAIYSDTPYSPTSPRMLQITCHYSSLSLFVKAGWFDAVSAILALNPHPSAYEKPDICETEEGQIPSSSIQRFIYPCNALTRDTYTTQPDDAVKILSLLLEHGFDANFAQKSPDDSAPRSPLGRALVANSHAGVQVLVKARAELVATDVSFRVKLVNGHEREYVAKPLAASILLGSLDCARVLLQYGASVYDEAFGYANTVLFAAAQGSSGILADLINTAPETVGDALRVAVEKLRPDALAVLLQCTADAEIKRGLWNVVLGCRDTSRDEGVEKRYVRILDMVYEACMAMGKPATEALRKAVEVNNVVGVEKCVTWGLMERNEVAKWCQVMKKGGEWREMLERCEKY